MNFQIVFLFISCTIHFGLSAKILGVFPPPAPSHYFIGNTLMVELAKRGHDVTFVSSFERKTPQKNLKDIILQKFDLIGQELKKSMFTLPKMNPALQFAKIIEMGQLMTEHLLVDPEIRKLLASDEKFDLIIMESFLSEAHMGLGYHFKAPTIIVSTSGSNDWINEFTQNPVNPAYVPNLISGFTAKMPFWDRVKNTILSKTTQALLKFYHLPKQNELLHKHFPDAPDLEELMRKHISLVLLNSHPTYSVAKPAMPNMIEIGGFHVAKPKELPKDLKQYLDDAKDGFILFSLGSNLKSNMLPIELRKTIMAVFARIPYKILWKFEDEQLEGKPENVKIGKWLPQNDILAHPNIKLFITHGGLLSTTEAIYHGIPIVGIPAFGDQKANMVAAEQMGLGRAIPLNEITRDNLHKNIMEVLQNNTYRENIQKRSALLRDQPLSPLETAMFWIELSAKHGYLNHLKTGAVDLTWYQIMLLDIIGTLLILALLIVSLLNFIIKYIFCKTSVKKLKKN